jgi:hypothetical protein
MHRLVIAAGAVALVAGLTTPGDAQTVVNGKQSLVDARVSSVQGQTILLGAVPVVNGIGMYPQAAVNVECTNTSIACSLGGTWWLDLDAAEAANPGAFINQPLVIGVVAVQNYVVGMADVSIRAWLQKK